MNEFKLPRPVFLNTIKETKFMSTHPKKTWAKGVESEAISKKHNTHSFHE